MTHKKKYKSTGVYVRLLYDALVENLHQRAEEAGHGEITPSHGLVSIPGRQWSRITKMAEYKMHEEKIHERLGLSTGRVWHLSKKK